jgi:hypothetical protein
VVKRLSFAGMAVAVLALGVGHSELASASQFKTFPTCHQDSSQIKQTGKHGSPLALTGSNDGGDGYYYLTITAGCAGDKPGATVPLQINVHIVSFVKGVEDADGFCWKLNVDLGYNHHPLQSALLMGDTVSLTFPNAVVGQKYRIRIASMEPALTVADHSSVDG